MAPSFATKEANNAMMKLGRKGDPRMHRAVAARMADPDISLLDALIAGGFDYSKDCKNDVTLLDSDGVTLGQRKNQLSRRLRLTRQSMTSRENDEDSSEKAEGKSDPHDDEVRKAVLQGAARKRLKRGAKGISGGAEVLADIPEQEDVDMSDDMGNIQRMAKYHPNFQPVSTCLRVYLRLLYCVLYS